MTTKTRAIRFTLDEEKKITEFLNQNSFFDFSALARTAILNFIESPTVSIKPIAVSAKATQKPNKRIAREINNENA